MRSPNNPHPHPSSSPNPSPSPSPHPHPTLTLHSDQVISSPMRSLGVGSGFSLCLLSGEVGVGKTHLLSEITSRSAAGEGGGSRLSGCVA